MNIVLSVCLRLRSSRGLLLDSLACLLLLRQLLCRFGGLLLNRVILSLLGLKLQDLFGSHYLGSAQVEVKVADIRIEECII